MENIKSLKKSLKKYENLLKEYSKNKVATDLKVEVTKQIIDNINSRILKCPEQELS